MTATEQSACHACEIHTESVFRIEGMDCQEEVVILERRLRHLAGVEALAADVMTERLRVTHDAARLTTAAIADAVAETGMRAWLEHEAPLFRSQSDRRRSWLVGLSGAFLGLGLGRNAGGAPQVVIGSMFGLSLIAGGALTGRRALAAVRTRTLDINILMAIAVVGAIAIGEWHEAATVVFLFALAQHLESRSLERARGAIRGLMDVTPVEVVVRRGGAEHRVGVDDVEPGEHIVVRPGQKIPLDGVVVEGESEVNQAPVTGESLPAAKGPGAEVFAGTINGRGALDIRVTKLRRDTTLARIIHLVERAQAERAPSQAFVDRFARVYTPVVLVLAGLVAVVPVALWQQPFDTWLYRALVLLVIACPCALVISTPVSIVSALAAAARHGVLIKGGVHLERVGAVRCVAFDKTGTVTRGVLQVVDVTPIGGGSATDLLALAASLEARSEHPIGRAIVRHALAQGVVVPPGDAYQALPGLGAEAVVGGREAVVGNHRLFEARGLCTPDLHERLDAVGRRGCTAVIVGREKEAVGIIAVADRPRETGRDTMDLLRGHGVEHLVLLTGDNESAASVTSDHLGLDEYRAELLPEDKVAAIGDLRKRYGSVAMVGDGVNDAPALAAADVGIAMGAAGTDVALETADVALMADDLLKLPFAVRLGRATLRTIQANIAFSFVLKAVFLVLAVGGMATLWMAVLADMGASLVVIANALRLLRAD
jgi:Cd2+/Zn2+-exporting ATPase